MTGSEGQDGVPTALVGRGVEVMSKHREVIKQSLPILDVDVDFVEIGGFSRPFVVI